MNKFSVTTIEKIGYYVYRLIDPRNGETFYVGKGKGNRVFEHATAALKTSDPSDKLNRIREIRYAGLEVTHVIQRWGLTEKEALLVESAVMDCYPGLTNLQGGHDNVHGVTNTKTLELMFGVEPYEEPDFNYILIKITKESVKRQEDKDDPIYEAARYAWKLDKNKVQKCPYVFVVLEDVVKGVFKVDEWYVTPEFDNRIAFKGARVPDLEEEYVNKTKIPDYYKLKGSINPVQYGKNNQ